MTLKELSQLYYLNREIEMDKKRLEELEAEAEPKGQKITGMPRAKRTIDKVGDCAAEIADLRGIIEQKTKLCMYERNRLERYISGIDDSLIRQIMTYRFVNGLPWGQVAANIGGNNTAGSVKMMCHRHLRKS